MDTSSDSIDLCRELVSQCADVNNISDTPILFRCLTEDEYIHGEKSVNLDCFRLILDKGADMSRPNRDGHLFLYAAIEKRVRLCDMKVIMRMILDRGGSVDEPNPAY